MFSFLPLGFAAPLVLTALIVLPIIWWLLRLTPPRPREINFPPTRLLIDVDKHEETPARSPWWLTLLRLLIAAAVIIALAGPIWRPMVATATGDGPLWLLVDNGWTSAQSWTERVITAERSLDEAEERGQPVLLAATADGPTQVLIPGTSNEARDRLRALEPRSWAASQAELLPALTTAATQAVPGAVVWMTDGLGGEAVDAFGQQLASISGDASIVAYTPQELPLGLKDVRNDATALTATVVRSSDEPSTLVTVQARDLKGLVIGESEVTFDGDAKQAEVRFELPVELRNEIARLQITGELTAGSVQLIDERWRRRTVGLVSGASTERSQPFLSPLYYLTRALEPFADLRQPRSADLALGVPELIEQNASVLILADIGNITGDALESLQEWVSAGGVLVRFAGPRLGAVTDELIPVGLRSGGRALGGSLSWQQPQPLGSFTQNAPFDGLDIPDDVTVNRQVLAEPDETLPDKTWASLADGTPLVTAERINRGWVVLFHVTADTSWSNLPISGTFVDMLRRILSFSAANVAGTGTAEDGKTSMLAPMRLLDGFGRLVTPLTSAKPVASVDIDAKPAGRENPPGLYGADAAFRALNLLRPDTTLTLFDPNVIGDTADIRRYETEGPLDMRAGLFVLALCLLLADAVAVLVLGSGLRLRRHPTAAAALLLALATAMTSLPAGNAEAQNAANSDQWALEAASVTHLAYVVTGNRQIDDTSRAGLFGLSQYLISRTALEPGDPVGVRLDSDELAFFPLIYWPIDETSTVPSARTMARVDAYMRSGGTVLFDTRDQLTANSSAGGFGVSPATQQLRAILASLDVPPLEPVPTDHVLSKAFYLLEAFPGRWIGSPLWVQAQPENEDGNARPVRAGDGVSSILITANDFAGAWASDGQGNYLHPTVPGDPSQREYAYRTGVNIVMYTLTGNYKADQVHVPALLERLGQ